MSTQDILDNTPDHLIYEHLVRALCEPIVIKIIKDSNEIFEDVYPNVHIISRGGDALNYYYGSPDFIPTHDWDFGIVNIPYAGTMNQEQFDILNDIANQMGDQLEGALNTFIREGIKNITFYNNAYTSINNLRFVYTERGARLKSLSYEYYVNGRFSSNALIDIYIMGDFNPSVRWLNRPFDFIMPQYQPKWSVEDILREFNNSGRDQRVLVERLRFLINETPFKTLFKNTFNLVIQDSKSGMKYIAPGDLLTDTMRMIYQSFFNIGIVDNKMDKYIMKYSTLLDKINKMIELCPGNTCRQIDAFILSRNTDTKDCYNNDFGEGEGSINRNNWNNLITEILQTWYTPNYIQNGFLEFIPSQKLCQIGKIFRYSRNRLGVNSR